MVAVGGYVTIGLKAELAMVVGGDENTPGVANVDWVVYGVEKKEGF